MLNCEQHPLNGYHRGGGGEGGVGEGAYLELVTSYQDQGSFYFLKKQENVENKVLMFIWTGKWTSCPWILSG